MNAAFYTENVSVERAGDDGDTDILTFEEHLAAVPCHIQPIDDSISADMPLSYGKEWLMMCPIADIQEGDRVIWNTKAYRVAGAEKHEFLNQSHMELRIRIFES